VSVDLAAQLPVLLPLAIEWAERQQALVRAEGAPLSEAEQDVARLVGVGRPRDVRILRVARIPAPEHPALAGACAVLGFLGPSTIGLTLSHGVFLRRGGEDDPMLLAHELRHVAQYEQHGGIAAYLAVYLRELLELGYDRAPFEIDARDAAARVIRGGGR
jgi:hypothetical protein